MAGNDIEHLKQQQAKLHHVADRGTPATIAAKEAASTIPIVMAELGQRDCPPLDPVATGTQTFLVTRGSAPKMAAPVPHCRTHA